MFNRIALRLNRASCFLEHFQSIQSLQWGISVILLWTEINSRLTQSPIVRCTSTDSTKHIFFISLSPKNCFSIHLWHTWPRNWLQYCLVFNQCFFLHFSPSFGMPLSVVPAISSLSFANIRSSYKLIHVLRSTSNIVYIFYFFRWHYFWYGPLTCAPRQTLTRYFT